MPFIRTHQQFQEEAAAAFNASQTGGHQAKEFFDAIKETITCTCARAHVIGLGCYCTACAQPSCEPLTLHSTDEWEFCLAFPIKAEKPSDVSTMVLLESVPEDDIDASAAIRNLCSLIRDVATESEVRQVLIDTADNSRMYRMKATKVGADGKSLPSIKYFAELTQPGNGLSTKDRLELALRLSLAIVQLCQTPWVSETWTWNDVCVSQVTPEEEEDDSENGCIKFPVMFILSEIYSVTYDPDGASGLTAVAVPRMADILDEEPVLTKLGLALIELAFEKSIQDIKEEMKMDGVVVEDHLANIYAAKRLLKNGKIRKEASKVYEGVVNVCIARQYIDREGTPKSLLSKHETFSTCFREEIILPLWNLWNKY